MPVSTRRLGRSRKSRTVGSPVGKSANSLNVTHRRQEAGHAFKPYIKTELFGLSSPTNGIVHATSSPCDASFIKPLPVKPPPGNEPLPYGISYCKSNVSKQQLHSNAFANGKEKNALSEKPLHKARVTSQSYDMGSFLSPRCEYAPESLVNRINSTVVEHKKRSQTVRANTSSLSLCSSWAGSKSVANVSNGKSYAGASFSSAPVAADLPTPPAEWILLAMLKKPIDAGNA